MRKSKGYIISGGAVTETKMDQCRNESVAPKLVLINIFLYSL